jgi:hypothetical protein
MTTNVVRALCCCLALVILSPIDAFAISKEEAKAEHVRLAEEMTRLAKRGHWRGVDRSYRIMENLQRKEVTLTLDDHYLAAQAARELGNVTLVYRRLLRAREVQSSTDAENWIGDIMRQYGEVELIIPERYKGEANLAVAVMPLQPDQRSTIGMAQQRITEGRSYNGLLPAGDYTFGPNTFTVVPGGSTIVLDLDKRGGGQVTTRAAGEKEPFRFTYMGPRADLGLGWTQATDPQGGAQPGGFSGIGGRFAAGWEMGVGGPFGVMVQAGYQGLSGGPGDEEGPLEELARFEIETDQLHVGFGTLMGTARFGPVWTALGLMYGVGNGQVTGVSQTCIDQPNSPECEDVGGSDTTLRYSRMTGEVRAAGGVFSAAFGVMEFGKFEGAVTLNAGALSDTERLYPFGSLGFTVGPAGQEGDG